LTNAHTRPAQRLAVLGYLMLFLGVFFGITALMGAIISHMRIDQTRGTIAHSHMVFQLAAFWIIVLLAAGVMFFAKSAVATWCLMAGIAVWLFTLLTGSAILCRRQAIPFFK